MSHRASILVSLFLGALVPACGGPATVVPDAGRSDAGVDATDPPVDGGAVDAGPGDAGCADPDRDDDGYMDPACGAGERYTDCDDDDPLRNPGAREVCDPDGRDEDCDLCTVGGDADHDDYVLDACCNEVDRAIPTSCVAGNLVYSEGSICGTDCRDTSATIHPGASETCNGIDDDCDGWADTMSPSVVTIDVDRDGHGDATPGAATRMDCVPPTGYAALADDCDDTLATVRPGGIEGCNGRDDDCDGTTDEDAPGVGEPCELVGACGDGAVTFCDGGGLYCRGTDATEEICNGIDDDCDGFPDDGIVSECEANECGATGPAVCVEGTFVCRYSSFPTRPAGPPHACAVTTERCRADGTWASPTTSYPERPCSTACGTGIEICRPAGWDACTASSTTECGSPACPDAQVGATYRVASCSGGVWGACTAERRGPRERELYLSGGDPWCRATAPGVPVTPPLSPTCDAGSASVPVEAGRYEVCASVESRSVGIPSTGFGTAEFDFNETTAVVVTVAGGTTARTFTRDERGRAEGYTTSFRRDDGELVRTHRWRVLRPAERHVCAEVTTTSCASLVLSVSGLRSPIPARPCTTRCTEVCVEVPGGAVCEQHCTCEPTGGFVAIGIPQLSSTYIRRLD